MTVKTNKMGGKWSLTSSFSGGLDDLVETSLGLAAVAVVDFVFAMAVEMY